MKRIAALVAIVLIAGCKTTPPTPPVTEGPKEPSGKVSAPVDTGDLGALQGRRICIDPGHGGPWPGAIAPSNAIREADVNLNVALRLQRMLEQVGATVIMTRTDDNVLQPENLAADLAARAAVANRQRVDAFISIHHNADIESGSNRNDLEVYYKLREEGASLDLAQALTRSLARELGATATARRLLPGNYKVLRLAEVPAVLLESSYMTQAANASALPRTKRSPPRRTPSPWVSPTISHSIRRRLPAPNWSRWKTAAPRNCASGLRAGYPST